MPAPKCFLKSKDIALVTGMSLRSAQYMLKMFQQRGQTIRYGKSNHSLMVDINVFVKYLCEQDGEDPKTRKSEIISCLKEARVSQ